MYTKNNVWISLAFATGLIVLLAGVIATGWAQQRSRDYLVAVEPQKSDTVRMIEAYERLSSQYLTLVQQNLAQMAATDRDILDKLAAIEQTLDQMSTRLERIETALCPADDSRQPAAK